MDKNGGFLMRLRKNFMPKPSTIIKKGIHQAIWGGHDLDRCGEKYFGYEPDYKKKKIMKWVKIDRKGIS